MPEYEKSWEALPAIMEEALSYMNANFGRYPYPTYSIIQGGDAGMEYPMATLVTGHRSLTSLVGVSVHEWLHSWYQMVLGFNESLYAWMDEGFNTFMNYYNWKQQYPDVPTKRGTAEGYLEYAQSGHELPIMTAPDRIPYPALHQVGYNKPALGLRLLREYVLGPDRFDPAFREYIRRWAYKHPPPLTSFAPSTMGSVRT